MKSYKKLWEKLKANITDQNMLALMNEYETVTVKNSSKLKKYPINITKQPWLREYKTIKALLFYKIKHGAISKDVYAKFQQEFSNWVDLLASREKSNKEMKEWLNNKHKEYKSKEEYFKNNKKPYTKPKLTSSGFERKTKSKLTLEDRAAIIIDELVSSFEPKCELKELNIDYYEEDWKQELWKFCWELKERDANLRALILDYNSLSQKEYKFRKVNVYSRMNRYIVPYIVRLQYSCNDIAKYEVNGKYIPEELYPSDNLTEIDNMNFDVIEKPNYIIEDVDIKEDNELISNIMENFEEVIKSNMQIRYTNYDMWIRYKKVIEMRYGFNSENRTYTLEEIGEYLDITRERVRQMEQIALQYIRNYLKRKEV